MKSMKTKIIIVLAVCSSLQYSCKKFFEIAPPKDSAVQAELFANDAIATTAVTGIYSRMTLNGGYSGNQNSISVITGLSSDELRSHNSSLNAFYRNEVSVPDFILSQYLWSQSYAYIYTTNAVLEGLQASTGVSESTHGQLRGEALFVRAFCYFYLVNLFGDVPMHLTTDYRKNEVAVRTKKEEVYAQIIRDLQESERLLPTSYISSERIRPNKWAATAMLARVYLYTEKWDSAEQKAAEVINQTSTYGLLDNLDQVFLKNSKETIWQLMPTAGINTREGALFVLVGTPTNVSLSSDLVSSFDVNDNRKAKWIGQFVNSSGTYFYPFKYKIRTTQNGVINEYSMVIRLAELYLIRAEARARLSKLELAMDDINLIRKRAGITMPLKGLNYMECLSEVERQRRFELFSEWGHRWLDLKRTDRATAVLQPIKNPTWVETDVLYPIPFDEITRNPNMVQNVGY